MLLRKINIYRSEKKIHNNLTTTTTTTTTTTPFLCLLQTTTTPTTTTITITITISFKHCCRRKEGTPSKKITIIMTALKRKNKVSKSHTTTTTTNQKGNNGAIMGGSAVSLWIRSIFRFTFCFLLYCYYIAILLTFLLVALGLLRLLFIDNKSILNKIDDGYDYYYNSISTIPAAIRTNNKIVSTQASGSFVHGNADAGADADVDADADFSVNFDINFNNPQIVILAGPHKTASTT